MNTRFLTTVWLLIMSTLPLSGCISLFPESGPLPSQISLEPSVEKSKFASKVVLQVLEPTAPLNLMGTKIAIKKVNEAGLTVYTTAQGQEWTQALPKLFERLMVDHFRSPSWPGVISASQSIPANYQLELDIRRFNIVLNQGVEVEINAVLFNTSSNKIEASQTFAYTENSPHSFRAYVDTLNRLTGQFLRDIGTFLESHMKN